jgi:hypothetical protein
MNMKEEKVRFPKVQGRYEQEFKKEYAQTLRAIEAQVVLIVQGGKK